jgi:hypothetical protein
VTISKDAIIVGFNKVGAWISPAARLANLHMQPDGPVRMREEDVSIPLAVDQPRSPPPLGHDLH